MPEAIFFFLFQFLFEKYMNIVFFYRHLWWIGIFGWLPYSSSCNLTLLSFPVTGMCLYLILFIVVNPSKNISIRGDAGGYLFFSVSMLFWKWYEYLFVNGHLRWIGSFCWLPYASSCNLAFYFFAIYRYVFVFNFIYRCETLEKYFRSWRRRRLSFFFSFNALLKMIWIFFR